MPFWVVAMRDPLTWSLPLGRMFGVPVRVHVLFPLLVLAVVLRPAVMKDFLPGTWIDVAMVMGLLFVAVLLHEGGHCLGARFMDGDAHEILIWPLGGLAYVEVPHTPRANFVTTAMGPLVNLGLCLLMFLFVLTLTDFHYRPGLNPFDWPTRCVLDKITDKTLDSLRRENVPEAVLAKLNSLKDNMSENRDKMSRTLESALTKEELGHWQELVLNHADKEIVYIKLFTWGGHLPSPAHAELLSNPWLIVAARFFWVNWMLFLLNVVLVGFPLDSGRLFQCILWKYVGYRQATLAAIFAGFVTMFVVGLYSVITSEVLAICLAIFIYVSCKQQWLILETGGEEGLFGYDFSQGYTSLERDEVPQPRRRRPNWWQRWQQRRAARRLQQEQEQREYEERRMDELLEKINREGKNALTDEEQRFLKRVSDRYRNRH